MAPAWLTYVATVTGIAGAVMGFMSLRRIARIKALDLRLELRKRVADLDDMRSGLPALLDNARGSRLAVAAALGTFRTGAMGVWKEQIETDRAAVETLRRQVPTDAFAKLTYRELEDRLVEIHRLTTTANHYVAKYRQGLAADDRDRERLHQDNMMRRP